MEPPDLVTWSLRREPSPRDRDGLTIRSVGEVRYRPPTVCDRPRGWHVDHLIYTIAGRSRGLIDGVASVAAAGSLWIHRKECAYRFDVDPSAGRWHARWIEVDGAWFRPLLARLHLDGVTHVPGCAAAEAAIDELFQAFRDRGEDADHEAAALVWRVLAAAERAVLRDPAAADPAALAVERARCFAREHLARDIGLADLARAAGMSPFHFARVFKRATGSAPIAFLRGARMARAQELLAGGEDIKRVARAVGYGSAAHFTTAFARAVGCAPGAWRAKALGRG